MQHNSPALSRVAFPGTGLMGLPMARQFFRSGDPVVASRRALGKGGNALMAPRARRSAAVFARGRLLQAHGGRMPWRGFAAHAAARGRIKDMNYTEDAAAGVNHGGLFPESERAGLRADQVKYP